MFTHEEISKGVKSLGLHLTEKELADLQSGQTVSLEQRRLSEIGSLFILASALCPLNSDKKRKTPLFLDVYETRKKSTSNPSEQGIPVYCWQQESSERSCLYLILADGIPSCKIVTTFSQIAQEKAS